MLDPKIIKAMALVTQVGISMLVPIFMMLCVGVWLEERFRIQLIPIFIVLGIGAGFRNCYILIANASKGLRKGGKNDENREG